MKVEVKRDLCIGAGTCIDVAPEVFDFDGEEIAIVVDEHGADDETLWEAAESCPVDAVFLYDEETGEQLYP